MVDLTNEDPWRKLEHDPEDSFTATLELDDLLARLPWWASHLPPDDHALFVSEFADSFRAATERGEWRELGHQISSWRATGETWADPEVIKAMTGPHGDYGPVPCPGDVT